MTKNWIAAALAAAVLAGPVQAQTLVEEVEVSVDLTAMSNTKAAAYWTDVADDLESAIVARLIGRTATHGARIIIDLDELSLASTFESAANIADSRLSGDVTVVSKSDNTVFDGYSLTVSTEEAVVFFAEGTDLSKITADSRENYEALVAAFASRVVSDLK